VLLVVVMVVAVGIVVSVAYEVIHALQEAYWQRSEVDLWVEWVLFVALLLFVAQILLARFLY
jgi:hypothetical protein